MYLVWVCKSAQQGRAPVTRPDKLSSVPGAHMEEKRDQLPQLSSDLHYEQPSAPPTQ